MDTAETTVNPLAELRDHLKARGVRRPVEQIATECGVSATTFFNWLRDGYVTQLEHGIALVEVAARYGKTMPIQRFRKPAVIPFPTTPQRASAKGGRRRVTSPRSIVASNPGIVSIMPAHARASQSRGAAAA